MNPILLKPNSDTGAQIIVHGKALTLMEAQKYQATGIKVAETDCRLVFGG